MSDAHRPPLPIYLLGVVILALLAGGTYALLREEDADSATDEASDETPLEVVRRYLDAYPDRDCDTLMDVLTDEVWTEGGTYTREQALQRCRASQGQVALDSAFEAVRVRSETGDEAVVQIKVTNFDGSTADDEIRLLRRRGAWKVDRPVP